ncbi:MAG: polysaccharide deacetylase family protein [Gemmatimonadetes bacterium]|nr:polysaccharide deacetylase family protein [Gemmatimonadota bacterium]MYK97476.1 polysaccharide deacetylase family protein [Gemmatimonadota bacterium]
MSLDICPWKYGKRWVYSITYDEALADLHRFAVPMHEEYKIPGHVEVVVGQLGEIRNIGSSSFNGYRHMNGAELRDLLARGWGVGNHSWSHEIITPETVDREIGKAKQVLEEALSESIILYCSPGDNTNMADHVLEACRRYGYLGAMSLTDALNLPGDELFWINRTALHDHYYPPFYSAYDPYRNIRQAQELQGWLIDYCHCPLETAVHPNKDCSEAQLRQRLVTVLSEGGDEVWCTVPEEALSYHLMRKHARIEKEGSEGDSKRYRIGLPNLPDQVPYRSLTMEAGVPPAWCRDPDVVVDGVQLAAEVVRPGVLRFTTQVRDGTVVEMGDRPRP